MLPTGPPALACTCAQHGPGPHPSGITMSVSPPSLAVLAEEFVQCGQFGTPNLQGRSQLHGQPHLSHARLPDQGDPKQPGAACHGGVAAQVLAALRSLVAG